MIDTENWSVVGIKTYAFQLLTKEYFGLLYENVALSALFHENEDLQQRIRAQGILIKKGQDILVQNSPKKKLSWTKLIEAKPKRNAFHAPRPMWQ